MKKLKPHHYIILLAVCVAIAVTSGIDPWKKCRHKCLMHWNRMHYWTHHWLCYQEGKG